MRWAVHGAHERRCSRCRARRFAPCSATARSLPAPLPPPSPPPPSPPPPPSGRRRRRRRRPTRRRRRRSRAPDDPSAPPRRARRRARRRRHRRAPSPPIYPPTPPEAARSLRLADLAFCHPTCFLFAMDDLERRRGGQGRQSGTTCGSFFIGGCPFDRDAFEAFDAAIYTPPALPPAPVTPAARRPHAAPVGAPPTTPSATSRGFDLDEMGVVSEAEALVACADGSLPPASPLCQTLGAAAGRPAPLLRRRRRAARHDLESARFRPAPRPRRARGRAPAPTPAPNRPLSPPPPPECLP